MCPTLGWVDDPNPTLGWADDGARCGGRTLPYPYPNPTLVFIQQIEWLCFLPACTQRLELPETTTKIHLINQGPPDFGDAVGSKMLTSTPHKLLR